MTGKSFVSFSILLLGHIFLFNQLFILPEGTIRCAEVLLARRIRKVTKITVIFNITLLKV